jgi:hypothetical protein
MTILSSAKLGLKRPVAIVGVTPEMKVAVWLCAISHRPGSAKPSKAHN